jgi:cold-inducible RNA-binding protein
LRTSPSRVQIAVPPSRSPLRNRSFTSPRVFKMNRSGAPHAVKQGNPASTEVVTVAPTARCMQSYALNAVKKPKFLSNPAATDPFTAAIATIKTDKLVKITKIIRSMNITMKIYVGNLSYETTEQTLRQEFEAFGKVDSISVITDRDTGRPRGFAFVEMPTVSEGQAAITGLNGKSIGDRTIVVNEARARTDNRSGGGYNRGRSGGYGDRRSSGSGGGRQRY